MPDFSIVDKLDLSGKRVVVSGGTQGIGAGIARLAARLGASIAIIGRNASLASEVLGSFPIADTTPTKTHVFIAADLSTIQGAKDAAQAVKDWAGDENVDLLFQTQGGPPSGDERITSDNLDSHFALQALSRFVLTYTLAKLGALRDSTVLLIASAGEGGDTLDLENIDSKGRGGWDKIHDSAAVLDCFTKFNNRYTSFRVMHVFPGMVRTNVIWNSDCVWYLKIVAYLIFKALPFMSLVGMASPDEYAKTAMWLATSQEVREWTEVCCWNQKGTEARVSKVAMDERLRGKVWDKLVGLTEGTAVS